MIRERIDCRQFESLTGVAFSDGGERPRADVDDRNGFLRDSLETLDDQRVADSGVRIETLRDTLRERGP
jgi:hypothetical protein